MAVSYKRLWRLLVEKEMSKSDLRKKADIAPNTMTKLRRDEDVSLTILSKICKTLNVDFGDIVEYVPDAEIWDLYNEKRELIGKDHVRGEQLPIDGYHLVVHVCIFNSEGKMLIQQRQSFKEGWSNLWDITVGGSAVEGDSSQTAAERELFEELGIKLDLQGVRPNLTINSTRCFNDVYLVEKEVALEELTLQYEEVQDARWATLDEILSMIQSGSFIPYYPSFIQFLFESRGGYGTHQR